MGTVSVDNETPVYDAFRITADYREPRVIELEFRERYLGVGQTPLVLRVEAADMPEFARKLLHAAGELLKEQAKGCELG